MAKYINVMIILGAFMAVFLQSVAAQTTTTVHNVGDGVGWVIPQSVGAAFYDNWAANNKFVVGDILMFNFTTNEHDVVEVPKASYDACTSSNPIGTIITTGPANITLSKHGDHYYICTFGSHCNMGQKLHITVSASPNGASPPSTTPTTPVPSPPTTKTNNTTPVDCVPPPASPPHAGGPATPPPTPGGPSSSAAIVISSFLLSMISIFIGLSV